MLGGSKHSTLPPSKSSRFLFESTRAVISVCIKIKDDLSHDHGLFAMYLERKPEENTLEVSFYFFRALVVRGPDLHPFALG